MESAFVDDFVVFWAPILRFSPMIDLVPLFERAAEEILAGRIADRPENPRGRIVGASIDFLTGKQRRATLGCKRPDSKWLRRLLSDPRGLDWRYFV
jgi:hypothetical protein